MNVVVLGKKEDRYIGFPVQHVQNNVGIAGDYISGKTSIATIIALELLRRGYTVITIDSNGELSNQVYQRNNFRETISRVNLLPFISTKIFKRGNSLTSYFSIIEESIEDMIKYLEYTGITFNMEEYSILRLLIKTLIIDKTKKPRISDILIDDDYRGKLLTDAFLLYGVQKDIENLMQSWDRITKSASYFTNAKLLLYKFKKYRLFSMDNDNYIDHNTISEIVYEKSNVLIPTRLNHDIPKIDSLFLLTSLLMLKQSPHPVHIVIDNMTINVFAQSRIFHKMIKTSSYSNISFTVVYPSEKRYQEDWKGLVTNYTYTTISTYKDMEDNKYYYYLDDTWGVKYKAEQIRLNKIYPIVKV